MYDDKSNTIDDLKSARRTKMMVMNKQAVTAHNNDLSITTMHQIAEMIIHLAIPISSFTGKSESYCNMWHKTIGDDIEGLKSMIALLDRWYSKIGEIEGE